MSLRKSPRRTRALLAANRRNSRKSTGPRTELGKWHSAGNAIRHYRRTHPSSCIPIENSEIRAFEDFHHRLRGAIIPAENAAGAEAVLMKGACAWKVKRILDRWIATRTEEDWLVLVAGAVPPPSFWRLRLRRPGVSVPDWTVTISVWLRWSRGPGQSGGLSGGQSGRQSRQSATKDYERPDRPRMHTMVSVHSTRPRDVARASRPRGSRPEWPCHTDVGPGLNAPEGARADPRACYERREGLGPTSAELTEPECERTKPESSSSQRISNNMSPPADWDPAYAEAYALAERFVGWLMSWGKRTKPEYDRKQATYKNMSAADESSGAKPNGNGWATGLGKVFRAMKTAFVPKREPSQLELFQTKPEYYRREGVSRNMSKAPGWLVAAAWLLMKRGPKAFPIPRFRAAQGRV